jgi:hypothetical protein
MKNIVVSMFVILVFLSACENKHENLQASSPHQEIVSTIALTDQKTIHDKNNTVSEIPILKGENEYYTYTERYFMPKTQYDSMLQFAFSIRDNYVLHSKGDGEGKEREQLYLLDLDKFSEEVIYSPKEDVLINDTCIGKQFIFWTEAHDKNSAPPQYWEIKAMNHDSKEVITIRESHDLEMGSAMMPRIYNQDDVLVWMEGTGDEIGSTNFSIYCYDARERKLKRVTNVGFINNPHDKVAISNNHISYVDRVNGEWVIQIININDSTRKSFYCKEIPGRPVCDGEALVWEENGHDVTKAVLYYYDFKSARKYIIDKNTGLFDMKNGNVVYSKRKNFYKFYKDIKKSIRMTNMDELDDKVLGFPIFFACSDDKLVTEDTGSTASRHGIAVIEEAKKK